jgi:hypothetical protein
VQIFVCLYIYLLMYKDNERGSAREVVVEGDVLEAEGNEGEHDHDDGD